MTQPGRQALLRALYYVKQVQVAVYRVVAYILSKYSRRTQRIQLNGYLADLVTAASKKLYWEYETNGTNLPADWQWVHIEDIAKLVSRGITPKYNEHSNEIVLGQTCIRGNLVLVENGRRHCPKRINEKWLQRGDLLINSTGVGSLGRTAQVWFDPEKLTVDSHITIVRTSNPEHALYLGFWAFAHERYIEALHTGSTGQTELPRDYVKSMSLVLPDAETLDRFNTIAKPAVKAIVSNQAENKQLSALRDALLPKLMSGEIDVSKVDLTQLNSHLSGC
ncbi:restriction endonuclease subunit S [uncultured Parolsenella sp.]|uniref:restriction endonuclease subunit S n=1 Tax=uncultured Parolsenella sp. TaxID=2083008 RepID=UPI003464FDD6